MFYQPVSPLEQSEKPTVIDANLLTYGEAIAADDWRTKIRIYYWSKFRRWPSKYEMAIETRNRKNIMEFREARNIKTVTIPAMPNHEGIYYVRINLIWECPVCSKPRGSIYETYSYDGSRRLPCTGWLNECGHLDKYADIRIEAKTNGLNQAANND